ncbi:hypothetical protein BX661DRAFT_195599 [Kickxella alabastrina]|uniref:uncharacterized protein n=1 Tax=Kickxella alabastrina TaxID=61397 RepID=UPI00221E73AD|nr:uncharacterized protein BX661DRAFT_195599 [Kickxella alabastrina]KAI7835043.1 hypothetical protein BX661DRAFT_195599 [Kickxella alabastrina]
MVGTFLAFLYLRSVLLLSVYTFAGVVFVVNTTTYGIVSSYPCFIDLWLMTSSFTMWHSTFTLLLARHYVVSRTHYNMAKQARVNMVTPDNLIEYLAQLQSKTHQAFWSDPSAHKRTGCAASESSHAGPGCRDYEQTIASNNIQSTLETTSINILVSTDSLPGTPAQQKEWSATRGFEEMGPNPD